MGMLNRIKIGPKLIGGFLLVAAIAGIIGVIGIINIKTIDSKDMLLYEQATKPLGELLNIAQSFEKVRISLFEIINTKDEAELQKIETEIADLRQEMTKSQEVMEKAIETEQEKRMYAKYLESRKLFGEDLEKVIALALDNKSKEALELLEGEAAKTAKEEEDDIDSLETYFVEGAKKLSEENTATANTATITMIATLIIGVLLAIALGLFLSRSISNPLGKVVKMLQDMAKGDIKDKLSMDRGDELGILAKSADTLTDTLKDLIVDDGGVVLDSAANKDLTKRLKKEYQGAFLKMKDNINKVIESLDGAMTQVAEATEQVSSASQQIASGGQSLAQGANEQASSLEEVSSSLEEMSSMTKQNAENANQAKNLAGEANGNAAQGSQAMAKMSSSINKIKESSDQTAKIVKTIDEIAMQTNLLALNAAVEAARAGEAGRGFAVVAEEVRNLAQRSAQAAKNTADMISESVKNAEDGVKISLDVAKSFDSITGSVKKVNDLIAEIAAASGEQSQGIDQVNTAVAQMDKVTQQNAANSEESASAAEELSSQAEELQGMVAQFVLSSSGSQTKLHAVHALTHHVQPVQKTALHHDAPKARTAVKPLAKKEGNGHVNPEAVIPMDEAALKEF
jgi:methyl-accepting chemotaxis protein